MRRWLLWLPLSLLTVLVLALGAALLARAEIAEVVARTLLDRRGFPDAKLTVATLTSDRLELTDVDLGPGEGPEFVLERLREHDLEGAVVIVTLFIVFLVFFVLVASERR